MGSRKQCDSFYQKFKFLHTLLASMGSPVKGTLVTSTSMGSPVTGTLVTSTSMGSPVTGTLVTSTSMGSPV